MALQVSHDLSKMEKPAEIQNDDSPRPLKEHSLARNKTKKLMLEPFRTSCFQENWLKWTGLG